MTKDDIRKIRSDLTPEYPELATYTDDYIAWVHDMWNQGDDGKPLLDWLIDFHPDNDQN